MWSRKSHEINITDMESCHEIRECPSYIAHMYCLPVPGVECIVRQCRSDDLGTLEDKCRSPAPESVNE